MADVNMILNAASRRGATGNIFNNLRPDKDDQLGLAMNWVYFFIKCLIALSTIAGLVIGIFVAANVLGGDTIDVLSYMTNTYYLSPDLDFNNSWPVLTSPAWSGIVRQTSTQYSTFPFEHFYECMWISQIAFDRCPNATVDLYRTCVLSLFRPHLDACAASPTFPAAWPSATGYSNCINSRLNGNRTTLNAFRSCVQIDLWPLYEVPQDVDSPYFLGSFSWPILMLTGFFMFMAFALYTIYPVDYEEVAIIEYGKVKGEHMYSRLSMAWVLLPILVGVGWGIVSLMIAFRAGSAWPNNNNNLYPSSQSTNILAVTASFAVICYFLLDLTEYYDRHGHNAADKNAQKDSENNKNNTERRVAIPPTLIMGQYVGAHNNGQLGYYFPDPTVREHKFKNIKEAGKFYTPVLINTWADAYLFDVLFFVGAIGATLHVGTAEIYNFFWLLVYYRLSKLGVARMIYQSYVQNPAESDDTNKFKDQGLPSKQDSTLTPEQLVRNVSLCFKINAVALHLSGICALIPFCQYIFDDNKMFVEFTALQNLVLTGLIIPEVLKAMGHVYLLLRTSEVDGSKGVYILVFAHFMWMYDIIIRLIFLYMYFYADRSYKGTKPFIMDKFLTLNTSLSVLRLTN